MKKFFLSSFVIVSFILYAIHDKVVNLNELSAVAPTNLQDTLQLIPTVTPYIIKSVTNKKYKDGEYTGDNVDAYYGNVQVKTTIQNGKITDVQFLDYPRDRRTSERINSEAMPYLKSEAIQAQSAVVDIVSGATQTSLAFKQSLQSALLKAKN